MADIQTLKSVLDKFRPQRVAFFYFSPLQKQQVDVQDPEITNNFDKNCTNQSQRNQMDQNILTGSFHNSYAMKTNQDTFSDANSFISDSLQIPKIKRKYLEDYVFLSNLGKGAFGRVQKLKCKHSSSIFAGKTLLKTSSASTNRYKNKKLQSEIKIYQKLVHSNIPQLHYIYTWKNQYTLIMEHVEGYNLHSYRQDHPNDQRKAARVIYQILDALEYLHSLNIVHHDLKPQNIIFDPLSQVVKLFDFGEAVQMNSSSETVIGQGGTFAYFAPEYFNNFCSGKLDIWACGIILLYLFSGKIYFHDRNKDLMKQKIISQPVVFEGYSWNSSSENVKNLIMKMLEKDHTKRLTASEAKNHPWILQNTKNWINPSKNLYQVILRSTKRISSIENKSKEFNQRKLNYELSCISKVGSSKKLSRFGPN